MTINALYTSRLFKSLAGQIFYAILVLIKIDTVAMYEERILKEW